MIWASAGPKEDRLLPEKGRPAGWGTSLVPPEKIALVMPPVRLRARGQSPNPMKGPGGLYREIAGDHMAQPCSYRGRLLCGDMQALTEPSSGELGQR
jgi:hypothetical protein